MSNEVVKSIGMKIMKKLLIRYLSPTVLIAFFLFIIVLSIGMGLSSMNESDDSMGMDVSISGIGEKEIPEQYISIYQKAGEVYHLPWTLLAAVHKVETNFGTNLNTSSAGAIGHMQFMPKTWVGWSYPGSSIPTADLMNLSVIAKHGGYGLDANQDGKADPYSVEDSVHAAAKYLSANGGASDMERAIFAYNRAQFYVDRVMKYFDMYTSGDYTVANVDNPGTSVIGDNSTIEKAIEVGSSIVGKSPYVWGGGRTESDIALRRFDCSSFVRWAYSEAGVNLGSYQTVTTDTLVKLGKSVPASEMKRGDLIFFNTYKTNGHVAIYLGNNQFLHDSSSSGVSIGSLSNSYWKSVFNGTVKRVIN